MIKHHDSYQWLHLSDLHVSDSTSCEMLLAAYKQLAQSVKPDALFVTGDFRHKIKTACTYRNALDFLNRIVEIFSLRKEDVFLIPGNHDANDFPHKREFVFFARSYVETDPDIYRGSLDDYLSSFSDYARFVQEFYGGSSLTGSRVEEPASVQCAVWNDKLNVIMLNTALVSDGNNDACEVADVYSLGKLRIREDLPSVILAHHPIERLSQSHQKAIRTFINGFNVYAYLCGDAHRIGRGSLRKPYDTGDPTPEFICGKSAVEDGDTFSDVGAIQYVWSRDNRVTVYPFMWKQYGDNPPVLVESPIYNRAPQKKMFFTMPFPTPDPKSAVPHEQSVKPPAPIDDSSVSLESQSNLFQIAGKTIRFVPIICSWNRNEDEYVFGDVTVTTRDVQHLLPEDIIERFEQSELRDDVYITGNTFEPKVRIDDYSVHILGGSHANLLVFRFSKVYYRDFLIQRLLMDKSLKNGQTLRQCYFNYRDSLITDQLTNICGVGIFIITSDQMILISKSSKNVAVAPSRFIYTASGTMNWDGKKTNPFQDIVRETQEEIGYQPNIENLRLYSFGIDYDTGYYQFSFYEQSNKTAAEIIRGANGATDYHIEIERLIAIPFHYKQVLDRLRHGNWDETAKANLITLLTKFYSRQIVERYLDPLRRTKATRDELLREWDRRAERKGKLAVLSNRYPSLQIEAISDGYCKKVISFIDDDLSSSSVLEVGGGIGLFTRYFAEKAASVTCVDVSEKMIRRNKAYLGEELVQRVTFVHEFFQDFEPNQTYDILVCSLVLIHNIDDLREFTEKMKRCADTIYLFEHVEDGVQGSRFTHPKTKAEYINLFPEYDVEKTESYMLFTDLIACIKLVRQR